MIRRLAGEAHRPERRAHVDLAVGRLEHEAAARDQDLHAIEARVVGEGAGRRDRRAAEAPDLAFDGDVDGDAAAVLPRRAAVLPRIEGGNQGTIISRREQATVPWASKASISAAL